MNTFVRFQPSRPIRFGNEQPVEKKYSEAVETRLKQIAEKWQNSSDLREIKSMYEYANSKQQTPNEEKSFQAIEGYLNHAQIYMMTEAIGENGGTYQQYMDQAYWLSQQN